MLHLNEKPPTLKEASLGENFPPHLEAIVAKLLQKDPALRFQSAVEVADALKTKSLPSNDTRDSRDSSTKRTTLMAALCALIVIVVGAAIVLNLNEPRSGSTVPNKPEASVAVSRDILASASTSKKDEKLQRDADFTTFMAQIEHARDTVDANGFAINDADLNHLKTNHRLSALKISNTGITDKGFKIIGGLQTLRTLHADHTKLTNSGVDAISNLSELTCLHASQNDLDDKCTSALSRLSMLTELTLRDDSITDAGIRNLSGLKHIRHIQLNRTLISDNAIKTIVESYPDLQDLHVKDNSKITKQSLVYLDKAKNLRKLTVSGCSIAAKDLRDFLNAHPQVKEVTSTGESFFLEELGK